MSAPDLITFPAVTARTFTLPNGLGIIVQEDRSAPVVSVQAWVETGSIHEGRHLGAGMSHMLEHMLFKGTKTRGASDFARGVQDAGGYINAYTSFDRTVYWIDIPAKGAPIAIELLADAMMNSTLPPEEFVKEQEVIRREFAMGNDDPGRVASHQLFATAYCTHPYALPVIGHLDVFDAVTRDEVMAYYRARYVPNNIFFVVAGDVEAEKVRAQLAGLFAPYPRVSLPPVFIPQEPEQLGRREAHTEFNTELTRLHLVWHIPAITHPDVPALDVLAMVLGAGRSSRLYRRLREDLGLVHSIDAWCYAPGQPGLFGIDAVLDPDKRTAVEAEVARLLAELHDTGVSERELEKARKMSLSHQLQSVTTMRGRASDLGGNWLLTRNLDFSRDYLAAVQRVSPADLRRVLATWLHGHNLTVSSLNPEGTLAAQSATALPATAGEVQQFELPNGLRLLVREDARLPLVSMVAAFKAGVLAETPEKNGATKLLARVLLKGTKTRTAEQIADEIEAVGGTISADAGNNSLHVSVATMRTDLALGLDVLADVLLHATLPEKAIAREKDAQLAWIKADEEEMTSVARNLLRAELFSGHPYGLNALGTADSVAALSQADLAAFRERHVAGRNGVLAVFGDVRAAEVKALVARAFAELPAGEPALADAPQPAFPKAPREVAQTKDKEQAVLMAGFPGVDFFSADEPALELIDEACSDLGSRLFVRIREEMGLAYFVGSSNLSGLVRGCFSFYLGTDPAKLDAVKAALLDEIARLASDGLTAGELARAKEKIIGQQEIRLQSNHAFATQAALHELYGLGHSHHLRQWEKIAAVTLEDVRRVAAQYFTQPGVVAVVSP
jgi:zinc protease